MPKDEDDQLLTEDEINAQINAVEDTEIDTESLNARLQHMEEKVGKQDVIIREKEKYITERNAEIGALRKDVESLKSRKVDEPGNENDQAFEIEQIEVTDSKDVARIVGVMLDANNKKTEKMLNDTVRSMYTGITSTMSASGVAKNELGLTDEQFSEVTEESTSLGVPVDRVVDIIKKYGRSGSNGNGKQEVVISDGEKKTSKSSRPGKAPGSPGQTGVVGSPLLADIKLLKQLNDGVVKHDSTARIQLDAFRKKNPERYEAATEADSRYWE